MTPYTLVGYTHDRAQQKAEDDLNDPLRNWQGRRVFLTGHTGFKGCWLATWLNKLGAKVRGYALDPPTEPNMFTLAAVGRMIEDVRGDIRDVEKLQSSMKEFVPEVVFHMAAQALVRQSYADPTATYATNVMGTVYVLEAIRKTPSVRAVVCVTTDKVYENREWVWPYRETDQLGGYDPYASSKACAEMVCAAYQNSFFAAAREDEHHVALATARAGNVIGGGDWAEDRLIPDLVRGFRSGKPVLIRSPNAIRPWQYVLEPLRGYITLSERLLAPAAQCASSYNFGPSDDDAWPVERIANKIVEMWGSGASWRLDPDSGAHESNYLRLDASRASRELGWQPRLKIEAALELTTAWYRAWNRGENMAEFTAHQILEYEKLRES
jgi:CDP-glucose 4,6-dehydratase